MVRGLSLVVGLFLFAFGIVLQLQSELGLSPWDVLNQGISERTSLSFGHGEHRVAVVVLAIAWALGARIGIGTVANAVLIGLFVDAAPRPRRHRLRSPGTGLAARIALLVSGDRDHRGRLGPLPGAALGAGPRDSLMIVGARRTGTRIGVVRAVLEIGVAAVGFALGGTVGIGTLAFAFGIGPAVEVAFGLLLWLGLAEPSTPRHEYDRAS